MIKNSQLEFHETFQPETSYIAKILHLAAEQYTGTKFEISEVSGIPTGKQKGKVEPHIKYAGFMGLIDYTVDKTSGKYSLSLTDLGREVFQEDPYLNEKLSCWICHYGITRTDQGAPQWSYLVHTAHPGFGEAISQEHLFDKAGAWCDVSQDNMLKKVFSVVKSSYTVGFFEKLHFLNWDNGIRFEEHDESMELLYVYAYALFDSWGTLYPDKPEITEVELKNELGFDKVFGLNEDQCNYVIDSLAFEGLLSINRQLYPATLIRISDTNSIISQLYSRLL